jgi:hypothetical protein
MMSIDLPDFDTLMALHRFDPQAFEQLRKQMLRQALESAPAVHRPELEQLLLRIEEERATAASPADAALIAFRLMGESLNRLHEAWGQALQEIAGMQASVLIERVSRTAARREDTQRL